MQCNSRNGYFRQSKTKQSQLRQFQDIPGKANSGKRQGKVIPGKARQEKVIPGKAISGQAIPGKTKQG